MIYNFSSRKSVTNKEIKCDSCWIVENKTKQKKATAANINQKIKTSENRYSLLICVQLIK